MSAVKIILMRQNIADSFSLLVNNFAMHPGKENLRVY
jgi:hypothetical protein